MSMQFMCLLVFRAFFVQMLTVVLSGLLQNLINMQDAIIHNMYDDDLSVVEAALSIEGLAAVASPVSLLKVYDDLLANCINIIHKGG